MNREFWESWSLDDEEHCRTLAEKLTGLDLSQDPILRGLNYMIALQTADRFTGFSSSDPNCPPWRDVNSPDYAHTDWWHYRITTCLHFKPTDNYMTLEGWPLGTECWYSTIELGWREHTCSPTPELAIYRALVLSRVALDHRAEHPKKRPYLEDLIAAISETHRLSRAIEEKD